MDFPNLPYFKDGNVKISETLAIHQYIADKWDPSVLGTNPKERAKVVMMGNITKDIKMAMVMAQILRGSKEEAITKMNELLPPILKF